MRNSFLRSKKHTLYVCAHKVIKVCLGNSRNRQKDSITSIHKETIKRPYFVFDESKQILNIPDLARIGDKRECFTTQLLQGSIKGALTSSRDYNSTALFCYSLRDGKTNPAASPSYQYCLAFKSHSDLPFWFVMQFQLLPILLNAAGAQLQ